MSAENVSAGDRTTPAPIVLPSTLSAARQAALIYFHGAMIDPKDCVPLCRAIQAGMEAHGVALHVAIPAAPPMSVDYTTTAGKRCIGEGMHADAVTALEERCGFRPTPRHLFFAGHSFGSIIATGVAFHTPGSPDDSIAEEARAVCIAVHGGWIREEFNALSVLRATPTAEILGDRDGLIRLNNFSLRRAQVDANVPDVVERARIAPVVILPGVSHTSFCDGATSPYVAPRDTPPTVSTAAGAAAIADATVKFMVLSDPDVPADAVAAAAAFFQESTRSADAEFFDVYRGALARDKAGDTTRDVQRLLLGLDPCAGPPIKPRNPEDTGFTEDQVTVLQPETHNVAPPDDPATPAIEYDKSFLYSKPKMFDEGAAGGGEGGPPPSGRLLVLPQSSLALRSPEISVMTSVSWAPPKLRCKLKSGHAVATALGAGVGISPSSPSDAVSSGAPGFDYDLAKLQAETERLDPFTAARINEHVVLSVLGRLPQRVRSLYEQSPRRLAFGPDVDAEDAPSWAASNLSFCDILADEGVGDAWRPPAGAGGVVLRSERFSTDPGDTRFNGMFYCTIISEAKAFEYIMYESQMGPGIEVDAEGLLQSGSKDAPPVAATTAVKAV